MVIAQVLVDVGGCHLTGGNGANSGSRPGDAVASGEHVVHVADLAGQSSHQPTAAGNGHAGLVKALNLDALANGHHNDVRRDTYLIQGGPVGSGTARFIHIADNLGLDPQGSGHAVVVGLDADRGSQGYHLRSLGGCTGHLVGQGRHILQAAAVHTADLAGSQTDRTAGDVHSHVAAADDHHLLAGEIRHYVVSDSLEHLHSGYDVAAVLTGDAGLFILVCADGDVNTVVLLFQLLQPDVAAYPDVGADLDPQRQDGVDFCVQLLPGETIAGNTIAQHAAQLAALLKMVTLWPISAR